MIEKKIELTHVDGAWVQYEHLARWLIYLASSLELKGTSIENIFLEATLLSMRTMRRELKIGYSWYAYTSWSGRWTGIIASNRTLIREYIQNNTDSPDALAVVNSG